MTGPHRLARHVAALEDAFRTIERTRMAGVALLNPRLSVRAVGFEVEANETDWALGVLITPWFMNLVRLPLTAAADASIAAPGQVRVRPLAASDVEFSGVTLETGEAFESCSLFSPMQDFADQAGAEATAFEVLRTLRSAAIHATPPGAAPTPARRAFLFGRSAHAATPRP